MTTLEQRAAAPKRDKPVLLTRERLFEIAHEAHTMGRVYTRLGERHNPADEFDRIEKMVERLLAVVPAPADLPAVDQAAPREQQGWQMVPVEPTQAMLDAFCDGAYPVSGPVESGYRAMLAAAPPPSGETGGSKP